MSSTTGGGTSGGPLSGGGASGGGTSGDHSGDNAVSDGARAPVVGIVGKCCAGKDLATTWFLKRGRHEINVDKLGHRALEVCREEVLRTFGSGVLTDDRSAIDRRRLGNIVFSDRRSMEQLEAIVHPWMREEVRRLTEKERAAEPPSAGVVINAAMLLRMGLDRFCDAVLLVRAPLPVRLVRAVRRDGFSWRRLVLRVWSQRRLEAQAHLSSADIIIVDNRGTPQELYRRLERIPQLQ